MLAPRRGPAPVLPRCRPMGRRAQPSLRAAPGGPGRLAACPNLSFPTSSSPPACSRRTAASAAGRRRYAPRPWPLLAAPPKALWGRAIASRLSGRWWAVCAPAWWSCSGYLRATKSCLATGARPPSGTSPHFASSTATASTSLLGSSRPSLRPRPRLPLGSTTPTSSPARPARTHRPSAGRASTSTP